MVFANFPLAVTACHLPIYAAPGGILSTAAAREQGISGCSREGELCGRNASCTDLNGIQLTTLHPANLV